jgi:molybdopterin biosynthesis enzyme MoaB
MVQFIKETPWLSQAASVIVRDDVEDIKRAILETDSDLVLLSGGTGFTPDDVTPEAVLQVVDKTADSLV